MYVVVTSNQPIRLPGREPRLHWGDDMGAVCAFNTSVLVMMEERGVCGLVFSNTTIPFVGGMDLFPILTFFHLCRCILPLFHSFSGMLFFSVSFVCINIWGSGFRFSGQVFFFSCFLLHNLIRFGKEQEQKL